LYPRLFLFFSIFFVYNALQRGQKWGLRTTGWLTWKMLVELSINLMKFKTGKQGIASMIWKKD
jgi:hypothetical protein